MTGVQTCALPICWAAKRLYGNRFHRHDRTLVVGVGQADARLNSRWVYPPLSRAVCSQTAYNHISLINVGNGHIYLNLVI